MRILWQFYVILFGFGVAQNDRFDYECDILQRLNDLESKVKGLEDVNVQLANQVKGSPLSGSTYIRWGRTTCSGNGSELVYHGIAGGGAHDKPGSATNRICLPWDPEKSGYYDAKEGLYDGTVRGVEYQFNHRLDYMKFFPDVTNVDELRNHNAPCAVCYAPRNAVIVVPAKTTCMDGWTLEYKGLLFSNNENNPASSEYICVDDKPEVLPGGGLDENPHSVNLLRLVEIRCSSLPCPPYQNGRELTCAVCTK